MPFTAPRVKAEFRSDGADDNIAAGNSGAVSGGGGHQEDDTYDLNRLEEETRVMASMGLPTQQPSQAPSRRKGDYRESFSCRVCNIADLNSLETKTKHEGGINHIYNIYKAYKKQELLPEEREDNPFLQVFEQGAPTQGTQRRGYVRLCEKLQDTIELVVGLEHVTEIIACSSEEEPFYRCHVCEAQGSGCQGEAHVMFNHLLGEDHRRNFLKSKKPHVLDESPSNVLRELAEFGETDWMKIRTIYSDELYPWSPGKAPWCVERGGTGEVPNGARNAGDLCISAQIPGTSGGSGPFMSDSKAGLLPADIETFAKYFSRIKVRDTPDVRRACDLVADIVRKVTNEQKDLHDLHTLDVIKSATYTNLAALKGLGHRRDKGQVPGQDELWAEEAQKQKIKRERVEDEGHGDPGTSHGYRDRRDSPQDSRGTKRRHH